MSEQPKRLAIVTGAARGIGRAIVLELLKQGREVVGLDINQQQLDEMEQVCKQQGFSVTAMAIDITDTDKLTAAVDECIEKFGPVGVLVNNAGITRDGLLMQMSEDDFDKVLQVNLRAAFVTTKAVIRSMVRAKFGRIISLSSTSGVMGNPGQANYAASKAGLIGFSKSIAREMGKKNITANCVAPGFIDTDMTKVLPDAVKKGYIEMIPARRMGTIDDVAKAIAFLASDDSGYITGQVLCVDGGLAM